MSFFNDTATTEIYTLSLHDALPILSQRPGHLPAGDPGPARGDDLVAALHLGAVQRGVGRGHELDGGEPRVDRRGDRKSTRLNSSHANISYAVFCLKKKRDRKSTRLN